MQVVANAATSDIEMELKRVREALREEGALWAKVGEEGKAVFREGGVPLIPGTHARTDSRGTPLVELEERAVDFDGSEIRRAAQRDRLHVDQCRRAGAGWRRRERWQGR